MKPTEKRRQITSGKLEIFTNLTTSPEAQFTIEFLNSKRTLTNLQDEKETFLISSNLFFGF